MKVHESFKFDPNPKWAWKFKELLQSIQLNDIFLKSVQFAEVQ